MGFDPAATVATRRQNTFKPQFEGNHIKIVSLETGESLFEDDGYSKLSSQLVEAFLDDGYRVKLLSALAGAQRTDALRWLSGQGFTVYPKLPDPTLNEFPPK
jgi:hypothetical protein